MAETATFAFAESLFLARVHEEGAPSKRLRKPPRGRASRATDDLEMWNEKDRDILQTSYLGR